MKKQEVSINVILFFLNTLFWTSACADFNKLARIKNIDDDYRLIEQVEKQKKEDIVKKAEPPPVAKEFIDRIAKINSYSADFVQYETSLNIDHKKNNADNKTSRNIKGNVNLTRPNKFLWSITSPSSEKQSYITNGNKLWHYDVGLEQVVVDTFDLRKISHSPFYILLDNIDNISKNYIIEKLSDNSYKLSVRTKAEKAARDNLELKKLDRKQDQKSDLELNKNIEQEITDLVDVSNPNVPKILKESVSPKDLKNKKANQEKLDKGDQSQQDTSNINSINKADNYISDLQIYFASIGDGYEESKIIKKLSFIAGGNKKIIIELSNVNVNPKLGTGIFNFKPPNGVDVITVDELK